MRAIAAAVLLAIACLAAAGGTATAAGPKHAVAGTGTGQPPLSDRALQTLTAEANGGDLEAMYELARRALHPGGPPYWRNWGDVRESERWWQKAAALGDPKAMILLGRMYAVPWGVPQDLTQAARWFEMAAKAGNLEAVQCLINLYTGAWSDARDDAAANLWIARAVEMGDTHAMLIFGLRYDAGWGVREDAVQAAAWYEKVIADQRSNWHDESTALNNLGALYETGRGVPKDESKAAQLYRKAAGNAWSPAAYNLAMLCEDGRGVPQDKTAALWLLRDAALIQNMPEALAALKRLGFEPADGDQEAAALDAHERAVDSKKGKTACEP